MLKNLTKALAVTAIAAAALTVTGQGQQAFATVGTNQQLGNKHVGQVTMPQFMNALTQNIFTNLNGPNGVGTQTSRSPEGGRVQGYAAGNGGMTFGAWAAGSRTDVDNDETLASFDGDIWQGFVGGEVILKDRFTVGLAAGIEDSDFDTDFNGGDVEIDGWSITPYASVRLSDQWVVNALVSYADLDYDVSNGLTGTTGDFNGDRWVVAGELKGDYRMDSIALRPVIGWSHAWDSQDSYTDSSGTRISGNSIDVGRIYAGGQVGYAAGMVEPYLTGRLKFDYDEPGNVPVSATSSTSYDEFTAEVGAGININLSDNLIFNLQGTYDSLGADDIDAWRAEGKIKLRF